MAHDRRGVGGAGRMTRWACHWGKSKGSGSLSTGPFKGKQTAKAQLQTFIEDKSHGAVAAVAM